MSDAPRTRHDGFSLLRNLVRVTTAWVVGIAAVLAAAPSSAQVIYAGDRSGAIYRLDPMSGAVLDSFGTLGLGMFEGLAVQPGTGRLFGVTTNNRFVGIDTTSGEVTLDLGIQGAVTTRLTDIAFAADGTLYGVDRGGNFYTINPATAALSTPVNNGSSGSGGGITAPPAGGDLYWTTATSLIRINPATRAVTSVVGALASGRLRGLAVSCDGAVLYGSSRGGNQLLRINPSTGAVISSSVTGIDMNGLAVDCVGLIARPPDADDSAGNGNGLVDPNELVTLQIPLKNFGVATVTGVEATLSTSTPGVTITQAWSPYPNLGGGATASNTSAYALTTSSSFVRGTTIHFSLEVTTAAGVTTFAVLLPTSLLYTVDRFSIFDGSSSMLSTLDPETGRVHRRIGPTGVGVVTGLALHPSTGVLYGVTGGRSGRRLVTIDRQTGAGTIIGNLNTTVTDIAFRSDGTLFGVTNGTSIVSINLTTGNTTVVAITGLRGGIAFSATGRLYVTDGVSAFRTLDPGTLAQVASAPLNGGEQVNAMGAGCDGQLYAIRRGGTLLSIDPDVLQISPVTTAGTFRTFDSLATYCTPQPSLKMSGAFDDPLGNHDGAADPGETIDIAVTIKNRGAVTATAVTATATTSTPHVTMIQGNASLGDIGPGTSAVAIFRVTLGAGFVRGSVITLIVHSTLGDGTVTINTVPVLTGTLFGGDNAGNLYRLNASGLAEDLIGNTGMGAITGLAMHPSGVLYGVSGGRGALRGSLYVIDKTTANALLIGPILANNDQVTDITFGSDGTLYGISRNTGSFLRIATATGQATIVRSNLYNGGGLAADSAGTIFHLNDGIMWVVDPTTGLRTQVSTSATGRAQALTALCAGGLLSLDRNGGIFSFDTQGGTPTLLSQRAFRIGLDALAMECQRRPALVRGQILVSGAGVDGIVDPGETASLSLRLQNFGNLTATAISATLSTTTTGITVTQATSTYADIGPAGSAANAAAFVINASSAFATGTTIRLTLTVTTAEGIYSVPFVLFTRALYASTALRTNGTIFVLDPETGSPLSSVGVASTGIGGLALHPVTHELYGVTQRGGTVGALVRIDKSTGVATMIGTGIFGGQLFSDITFAPDGTLYGLTARRFSSQLIRIDTTTGAGVSVGFVPGASGGGLAFSPTGELWQFNGGVLRVINPATAQTIRTQLAGFNENVRSLATSCDGSMYASTTNNRIWLVKHNGVARQLGTGSVEGLAFDCKPTVGFEYTSAVIDDSSGNGNGVFERNETVNLTIALRNLGAIAATGVGAVLSTSAPGVSVTSAAAAYADLASGATVSNTTPFVIQLGAGFRRGVGVPFILTLTTDQGVFPVRLTIRNGAAILYGADRSGILYTIDPDAGLTTPIGNTNAGNLEGLAVNPTSGALFAVGRDGRLHTLSRTTGAATFIANVGLVNDLTFTPDGSLYGVDRSGNIFNIDPVTGAQSNHSAIGNFGSGGGLTASLNGGDLFWLVDSWMVRIDPRTLQITGSISPGLSRIRGVTMACDESVLYASSRGGNQLLLIDPVTGGVQSVAIGADLNGVAVAVDACVFDDLTPPVIAGTPTNFSVEATSAAGAVVTYTTPTATDIVDGSVAVSCNPASSSTLGLGPHTVTCTATDVAGNTATSSFTVTVADTTPPTIVGTPADFSIEATGPTGAVVTFTAPTATDLVDGVVAVTCSPASGTTLGLGPHLVTCIASDAAHNGAAPTSFTVTVVDTTAPVITGTPANFSVEATGPTGAVVTFTAPTATDLVNGTVAVSCTPASGTTLGLGPHLVTCSASDAAHNNAAPTSFTVTVVDTTGPSITGTPSSFSVEATGTTGAVVTFTPPTAGDLVSGTVPVTCAPASGATLALGPHLVTCSASDAANMTTTTSFTVTVVDTTKPVINGTPANFSVEATGPTGAVVHFTVPTATDLVDGTVPVSCAPAAGTTLALGAHVVTCTAPDAAHNTATTSFTATVVDTIAPNVVCGTADGLWHPGNVTISCTASDSASGLTASPGGSFTLNTSVAAGIEAPNAATDSRSVCDATGNCVTAGPVTGNKIDRKGPTIAITTPPSGGAYLLNQVVASNFACSDTGSGLASCVGPVANGSNINTASVGARPFAVSAADSVGNSATSTNTYAVSYAPSGVCLGAPGHQVLEPVNGDGTSVMKRGSTVPVKFRVCDALGNSIGTPGVVTSFNLVEIINGTVSVAVNEDPVSATPDAAFRWSAADQQWIFNLNTKSLTINKTYGYQIGLNDGSTISFRFGLK
jgi:hypothetical protein